MAAVSACACMCTCAYENASIHWPAPPLPSRPPSSEPEPDHANPHPTQAHAAALRAAGYHRAAAGQGGAAARGARGRLLQGVEARQPHPQHGQGAQRGMCIRWSVGSVMIDVIYVRCVCVDPVGPAFVSTNATCAGGARGLEGVQDHQRGAPLRRPQVPGVKEIERRGCSIVGVVMMCDVVIVGRFVWGGRLEPHHHCPPHPHRHPRRHPLYSRT